MAPGGDYPNLPAWDWGNSRPAPFVPGESSKLMSFNYLMNPNYGSIAALVGSSYQRR